MTALPSKTVLDGTDVPTTAQFKVAMGQLRDYLNEMFGDAGGSVELQLPFAGATSGSTNLKASAVASGTLTLPAETGTLLTKESNFADYAPIIINHDGMINQRAAASNADDTYGFDRWNILTQTGTIAVSQITDVANGTPYMMRHTQSQASAQRFGTEQIVEAANSKRRRGKAITVAVKHKISSNANIRIAVLEWTGTADSVTSDVVNDWTSASYTAGGFFLGSNLTVNTVSGSVASTGTLATTVLNATLGSSLNNLIVFVWTEGTTAQNVTLDLAIDVKVGTYDAAGYVFPQRSIGQELALCQRYYERGYSYRAIGTITGATTTSELWGHHLVQKRTAANPTAIAGVSLTNAVVEVGVSNRTPTGFTNSGSTTSGFRIDPTGITFSTTWRPIVLVGDVIECNAEL